MALAGRSTVNSRELTALQVGSKGNKLIWFKFKEFSECKVKFVAMIFLHGFIRMCWE